MAEVGMHEAKTTLSKLVERALAGEEIVITRRGEPAVMLSPVSAATPIDLLSGVWAGQVTIADDFDELPDDIAEAFGMR